MQIQATGPTGVNSELSERESASPKARVYVSVCVCVHLLCVFVAVCMERWEEDVCACGGDRA